MPDQLHAPDHINLDQFRDDLTMHVHQENNRLFPRFEFAESHDH